MHFADVCMAVHIFVYIHMRENELTCIMLSCKLGLRELLGRNGFRTPVGRPGKSYAEWDGTVFDGMVAKYLMTCMTRRHGVIDWRGCTRIRTCFEKIS